MGESFVMRRAAFAAAAARQPADQASGLRRLFASRRRLLAVAANPFVPASQALLETLSAALAAHGRRVLVVDAASSAPPPHETALFDLAAGVERLDDHLSYLAARGVPLAHVDTHGSAAAFIDAAFDAAPGHDLMLLHADPSDLARIIGRRPLRPLLVGADRPESIKQAYAAAKLLVQRCGLMTFDLVLAADPERPRVPAIAERLASCADSFLGAVLHDWAAVDPLFDPAAAQDPALQRLLAAQLALDEAAPHLPATPQRSTPPARAAAPSPF
ncbi:MAG: flagellar biosynthesis protein [Proteobacteria bacterium]|nr:flagellar biosynthesis protein [Pseudomonadota bacterium]